MERPLGAESTVSRILGMELRSQLESGVLMRRVGKQPPFPPAAAAAAATATAISLGASGSCVERGAVATEGELTTGWSSPGITVDRAEHFLLAM